MHATRHVDARRFASAAFIAGGALLLIASATSMARGAIARDSARSRWAELEAQRAVAGGRASLSSGSDWVVARGSPIARLMIPRVGLDEVVVEGVGDDELRAGPGHLSGSALPGAIGRSVISAHRDRHFHSLGQVSVGDTILTDSDRGTVAWTVTRIRVVAAETPVLRSTTTPTLTLTTCWPIRYFGPAPERLIVDAEPARSRESLVVSR